MFIDRPTIYEALDAVLSEAAEDDQITVVHGNAAGSDMLANEWCHDRRTIPYAPVAEPHPVNWSPLGYYDASQGSARNFEMVMTHPDLVLAFYKIGVKNSGTRNCVATARRVIPDIEIKEFWK